MSIMDPELNSFLRDPEVNINPTKIPKLTECLETIGVQKFEDLKFVQTGDLADAGLTLIERRRFLSVAERRIGDARRSLEYHAPAQQVVMQHIDARRSLQYHAPAQQVVMQPKRVTRSRRSPTITVTYILCDENLFIHDTTGGKIAFNNLNIETMEHLVGVISQNHGIDLDDLSVELFSKEGYPLCLAEQKAKLTLQKWGVKDNDLFYAFLRPKDQSDKWKFDFAQAQPGTCEGPDELLVYGLFEERLVIRVNLTDATTGIIKKKIADITGFPTSTIELYTLPSKEKSLHTKLKMNESLKDEDVQDLVSGSVIFLHIQSSTSILQEYGKISYNPRKSQTDRGYSKFYSILKYLVHRVPIASEPSQAAVVTAVQQLTKCPPLAYSLMLLMEQRGFIHISQMTAIFEGFYQLCRTMLQDFCEMRKIPHEKTMEFCDYMFGMILETAKNVKTAMETTSLHPYCPITGKKVLQPVMIMRSPDELYEKYAAEQLIEGKFALPHGDSSEPLQEWELIDTIPEWSRLLLCTSCTPLDDLYAWKISPVVAECIPAFTCSCEWKTLFESLKLLKIIDPEALSGKSSVLSFIGDGRVVFIAALTKGSVMQCKVFDPLECEEVCYTTDVFSTFSRTGKDVYFHKIVEYLDPKRKAAAIEDHGETLAKGVHLSEEEADRLSGDIQEVVLVLIDTSASMREDVFDGTLKMKKIDAAKHFFRQFTDRTEAYQFKHVISAVTFDTRQNIKVLQKFTELLSQFRVSLSGMTTQGRTALYDALMRGIEELKKFAKSHPEFNPRLRILVLSDGMDNESRTKPYEVAIKLQKERITVDTVLITDPSGNLPLKAISHASGGLCFLPQSETEATRLFEMEGLLALCDRPSSLKKPGFTMTAQRDFEKFSDLSIYPYNSTKPYDYKSSFVEQFQSRDYCKADRFVQLAAIQGVDEGASSHDQGVKRILTELKLCIRNRHPDVEVFPCESNIRHWKLLIKGAEATPYSGGSFVVCVNFPNRYPTKPPEMRFFTPIYHCNINSSGRICHAIFGRSYSPSKKVYEIICQVFGLFAAPEPDDPLDSVLADEFHTNPTVYREKAIEYTDKYAKRESYEQVRQALILDSLASTDASCPLTGKLFVDPVITPFHNTYERDALMKHMAQHGNTDPISHTQFDPSQLRPNIEARRLADQVRRIKLK